MAEPLTRQLILETTRRQIEADGLTSLSLRRVARSLGVTAPALYAYVDDKRDLLRGVAESEFANLMASLDAVNQGDPVTRLREFGRIYIDHALASPELFRTMFLFPPELESTAATGAELPAATKTFATALGIVSEAIASGEFRPADPVTVALTMWASVHGLAESLLLGFEIDHPTQDELFDSVMDTLIAGLRACPSVEVRESGQALDN